MNPNQITAYQFIEQAQQAMKAGDMQAARQFAARAAQSAPELEDVWLILAALVSPRESVTCLQKALAINPQSERAQKGLLWAQKRLQPAAGQASAAPMVDQPVSGTSQPEVEKPAPVAAPESWQTDKPAEAAPQAEEKEPVETVLAQPVASTPLDETQPKTTDQPQAAQTSAVLEPKTNPNNLQPETPESPAPKMLKGQKAATRPRTSFVILFAVLLCLVLVGVLSQAKPVAAFFNANVLGVREHGPAWAQSSLSNPVLTPTRDPESDLNVEPTATLEPTSAPALAIPPTGSDTPAATETTLPAATSTPSPAAPTPTDTALPTETLAATETPLPTDLPTATIAPDLALADSASPTPLPTDTAVPIQTPYIAPTPKPNTAGTGTTGITGAASGARWIDVDLTHQMVYAYEGNAVVNSFLVSTGTWEHPTVTGQYHVYVKYLSTTMTGPGYSLPNVPYTMYFYKGYGLHGTYWHSNFGTPMSHGCVNLSIPDSQWLYNWASVGTLVNVHY